MKLSTSIKVPKRAPACAWVVAFAVAAASCGGGGYSGAGNSAADKLSTVKIVDAGANAVSTWSEIAINTINVPAATTGTAAEQRPIDSVDLASVHIAMYDALMIITGTHEPFYVSHTSEPIGGDVSHQAAVGAAAFGMLTALYPARSVQYRPTYDSFLASIPESTAKTRGLKLGAEVAAGVAAARMDDGRSVALAPYVPGTTPGRFRGANPINRFLPSVKPFALNNLSQFRPPPPFALNTAEYARDVEETRTLGGTVNSARAEAQTEIARFHTEPPFRFWPRNIQRFARTDRSLADHARLMAMVYVSQADATTACFEAKYFYEFWRPTSAISLADTDGNDITLADPKWTPVVPTPNHPEYPAAHACNAAAIATAMRTFYETEKVEFTFDSAVTNTTHQFATTDALVLEIRDARIFGGMHFRNAMLRGEELGEKVALWVSTTRFKKNK